jgi:hypothetical protein
MAFDASTIQFFINWKCKRRRKRREAAKLFWFGICCVFTQFEPSLVRDRYPPLRLLELYTMYKWLPEAASACWPFTAFNRLGI